MSRRGTTTKLTKKEKERLVQAAAEGYFRLPLVAKVIVAIIAIVIVLFCVSGYFSNPYDVSFPTAYTDTTGDYAPTEWVEAKSPQYYRIDGAAIIQHGDIPVGEIHYGGLDALGRATWAAGNITYDQVRESAGWRCDFTLDAQKNMAGWGHNAEVDIEIPNSKEPYHGWLFNRSHLVADSLGGYKHVYKEDGTIDQERCKSERKNLVTATRTQNVGANDGDGGMAICESLAIKYLKKHKNGSIYYSATPVYNGDDLLPRSVYVDMLSDDGSINMHIEVYNTAKGYSINYADGSWTKH